jgi:hypothetical protein
MFLIYTHTHHQLIIQYPPFSNETQYHGATWVGKPPSGIPVVLTGSPEGVDEIANAFRNPKQGVAEPLDLSQVLLNSGVVMMSYHPEEKKVEAYSHVPNQGVLSGFLPIDTYIGPEDALHKDTHPLIRDILRNLDDEEFASNPIPVVTKVLDTIANLIEFGEGSLSCYVNFETGEVTARSFVVETVE